MGGGAAGGVRGEWSEAARGGVFVAAGCFLSSSSSPPVPLLACLSPHSSPPTVQAWTSKAVGIADLHDESLIPISNIEQVRAHTAPAPRPHRTHTAPAPRPRRARSAPSAHRCSPSCCVLSRKF